jgi:TP901 family phage tail tape measure protein
MSQTIGFNDLFDKSSFDAGVTSLVGVIAQITVELKAAQNSASALASTLGAGLKKHISELSSQSRTLSKDIQDINTKMNQFKQTTAQTDIVIGAYEKETEKLTNELNKLKLAQEKANGEVAKAGKTAGGAKVNFSGLSQSLIGVASGAALVYRGVTILANQLKLAVQSTLEFEVQMKAVQAVTGATSEDLALLTANANKLGASTERTAGQIAELQKELGKLGFNNAEILASTEAIVDLSTATGEDLVKSGEVAAATLRSFGLEAIEMDRVVNVMVGSFNRSALDLEKFREAMKLVAPIAASTGVDIETVTAALAKLSDTGISGSLAGTAMRNLLSSMADPTEKLVKFLGKLNPHLKDGIKNSDDFSLALQELKKSNLDLATAVQMVDVRARSAFFTLVEQADSVAGLRLEFEDLEGEARRVAIMMRDTLSNDLDIAASAFDALRRNVVESFMPEMRASTQGITLMSEAFRFLVSDMREANSEMSDVEQSIMDWLTMSTQAKLLFGGLVDVIKEYVKVSQLQEARTGASNMTKTTAASLTTAGKELDLYKRIQQAFSEGKPVKDLVSSLKFLGTEYDYLREKITDGGQDETEVAQRTLVVLERNLRIRKGTLDQINLSITKQKQELSLIHELEKIGKAKPEDITRANTLEISITANEKLAKSFSGIDDELYQLFKTVDTGKKRYDDLGKVGETAKNKLSDLGKLELDRLEEQNKSSLKVLEGELSLAEARKDSALTIFAIEQEITKKKLDLALIAYQQEMRVIELSEDGVEQSLVRKEIAYEKYYNKLISLKQQYELEELKSNNSTEEEATKSQAKQFTDSVNFFTKLFKEKNKQTQKANKDEIKSEEQKEEDKMEILEFSAQQLALLTRSFFDNGAINRENEMKAIDAWEEERIGMAGDNEEAIASIEREAEERRKQIRIDQAKADKKEALFQIAIATAINIVKAINNPLKVALAIATGVIQAAVVAARPLPQFAKGTNYSPEGHAVVGERGRELIVDGKTGQTRLSSETASITHLSRGSKVIPHHLTERLLTDPNFDHNGVAEKYLNKANTIKVEKPAIDYDMIGRQFKDAVTQIPLNKTVFDENGVTNYVIRRSSTIKRINKRY